MPEPVVRVSANCSFSCALDQIKRGGDRGGTVFVPEGVWHSPPVNLTSHLTVFLAKGAVVKADPKVFIAGQWPLVAPLPTYGRGHDFAGPRWAPFLDGYGVTNLTIRGENGTIDGAGAFWWARHLTKVEKYTRPPLFSCVRCTDMLLEDTTFRDSAFWTIHPVLGRRLTARRIHILAPNWAPNTDGFDPDSTSDVLFEDSYVSNGDDAVAIKAGWDCAGYASPDAAPSDNITIRNVTQYIGGGGISIGSEMSGGISNVVVENVRLLHGSYGIQIKTGVTRGGYVKNVSMNNVQIVGTTKEAIRIDAYYGMVNTWCPQPSKRAPSVVDNISLTDVVVRNANLSIHFRGTHDVPATRVRLRDISFSCDDDGALPARGRCSAAKYGNCCLVAECFGGVAFTAADVVPASALNGTCASRASTTRKLSTD
jgi:polygalacturonase